MLITKDMVPHQNMLSKLRRAKSKKVNQMVLQESYLALMVLWTLDTSIEIQGSKFRKGLKELTLLHISHRLTT